MPAPSDSRSHQLTSLSPAKPESPDMQVSAQQSRHEMCVHET